MENNIMINPTDLDLSIRYYEAVLGLPLLEEITITQKFEVKLCDKCNKAHFSKIKK